MGVFRLTGLLRGASSSGFAVKCDLMYVLRKVWSPILKGENGQKTQAAIGLN